MCVYIQRRAKQTKEVEILSLLTGVKEKFSFFCEERDEETKKHQKWQPKTKKFKNFALFALFLRFGQETETPTNIGTRSHTQMLYKFL